MDSSYRRYRQYRASCQQYSVDQVAAPIVMMLFISFVTKYWWVIVTILVVVCVIKCSEAYGKKRDRDTEQDYCSGNEDVEQKEEAGLQKEEMILMNTTDIGYVNRNNQKNNGKTDIPGTDFGQWFYDMECLECGHKYHANGSDIWLRKCPQCQGNKAKHDVTGQKSTETGYVNKNNQRNNGKTNIPGTGNGQWFYDMECLNCGHKYHANGHDVWLRKCPKCQGGRP